VLGSLFPALTPICLYAFISTVALSNKWYTTRWFIIFCMKISTTCYLRSNSVYTKINITCIIYYLPTLPSKKVISQLKKFTGEFQPDAIHRTLTIFLHAVNTALKEGQFTPQVTTYNGPYTRRISSQLVTNPNTRMTHTNYPVGNTENNNYLALTVNLK